MKNLVAVFGTRPELIKLWPLVDAFAGISNVTLRLVFTRQHDTLVEDLLPIFGLVPDVRLDPPRAAPLAARTADLIAAIGQWLHAATPKPDAVLVQGDTATTLAGAMAAFYAGIPVVHVEAGLRSGMRSEPFPEELHRQTISRISSLHLSPTEDARDNLIREGIAPESIVVTGNTGIDAVLRVTASPPPGFESAERGSYVLATLHRRENAGEVARGIACAIRDAHRRTGAPIIVVLHASLDARRPLEDVLIEVDGVRLLPPQSYPQMAWLLRNSALVVTDSGGLQEEAAALGIPALVVRRQTDRPETVHHGNARVVGIQPHVVTEAIVELWRDSELRRSMSKPSTACGDGKAAERSVTALLEWLQLPRA